MKRHAVLILVAGCLIAADKPKPDAVKKEQKRLEGTWTVTEGINAGKPASAGAVKNTQVVFRGNKVIIKRRDKPDREYTYTVDPSKSPKQITVTRTDAEGKGDKGFGIYSLTKDTLKICMNNRGKERPEKWDAAGEGLAVLVLKRQEE
jgi:uncharacterized protein (TIGR03067 family)